MAFWITNHSIDSWDDSNSYGTNETETHKRDTDLGEFTMTSYELSFTPKLQPSENKDGYTKILLASSSMQMEDLITWLIKSYKDIRK